MKLQTFNNKGLIYGKFPMRISCNKGGALKIGTSEITLTPDTEATMPVLCNGCTGEFKATFTDNDGFVYELEKVTIQGGRIVPPPEIAVEFMELRCRSEALEKEMETLKEQIFELSRIFDTNSLNFII